MREIIDEMIEKFAIEPSKSSNTINLSFELELKTVSGRQIVIKELDKIEIVESESNYITLIGYTGAFSKLKELLRGTLIKLHLTKEVKEKLTIFEKTRNNKNYQLEGYDMEVHKIQENTPLVQGARRLI